MLRIIGIVLMLILMTQSILCLESENSDYDKNNNTEDISFREARRSNIAESCLTTEDASGTCMTRFRCLSSGGIPKGYCSGSYGVCCESKPEL